MGDKALILAVVGLLAGAASSADAQTGATGNLARGLAGGPLSNPSLTQITGRVVNPAGEAMTNVTVRARDLLSGQIGASTPATVTGQFSLSVNPGSHILEVLNTNGQIIGTSSFISATAGSAITGATITVTSGALTAATNAAGFASTLGSTAARSITYAAAAAGVAGVITPAAAQTASPSR